MPKRCSAVHQRVNPWWFRATVLAILVVAAVPRMAVIPGMTAFLDELFWLADARQVHTILADGRSNPRNSAISCVTPECPWPPPQ